MTGGSAPARLRLGAAGIRLLLAAVVVATAGIVLGVREALAAAAAMSALVVFALLRALLWSPRLDIERSVLPATVAVGEPCRAHLRITNRGRRPSVPLRLRDELDELRRASIALAPLQPGARETVAFRVPTDKRGPVTIGPCSYELLDPFHLVTRTVIACGSTPLVVWPRSWQLQVPPLGSTARAPRDRSDPTRATARSGEFAMLAEYVPGDDPRHIHWPSSARTNKLLIRRFEAPAPGTTWILLDTVCANAAAFEVAVSLAASLLRSAASPAAPTVLTLVHADGSVHSGSPTSGGRGNTNALGPALDQLATVEGTVADGDRERPRAVATSVIRALGISSGDRVLLVRSPHDDLEERHGSELLRGANLPDAVELVVLDVPASATPASVDEARAQELLDRAFAHATSARLPDRGSRR